MEKVTAAVLITRREATAEASLARRRDLRKLGTAIAAMIRITATTSSNSIKEKPLWLRMNTPQASASVGGRRPGGVRPTGNPSSEDESSHASDCIANRWGRDRNIFVAPPRASGPGGGLGAARRGVEWSGRKYATPKSDWSRRLRNPSMAGPSARQGTKAEALRLRGCPQHAGGDGTNFEKK